MGNAKITSKESRVPEKSSGGDEDPAVRVRDFIGLATGVAGTVAAFLVGFGILPNSSLSEQSLNFFAAIGLSGAIIAGIGAWRSIRRFVVMWMFIGVVVICLAALAVVVQRQATSQSATSANRGPSTSAPHASADPVAPPSRVAATTSAAPPQVHLTREIPQRVLAVGPLSIVGNISRFRVVTVAILATIRLSYFPGRSLMSPTLMRILAASDHLMLRRGISIWTASKVKYRSTGRQPFCRASRALQRVKCR